ncbi:MAG TPA: hypothetical protein VIL99_18050 [Ignavibacteria bacterium]
MSVINKYSLQLCNIDSNLDLRKKQKEIETVFKEVRNDKIGLSSFQFDVIEQHFLKITVKESSNHWHTKIGSKLANEQNMRNFCKENEKSKMFKWEEI